MTERFNTGRDNWFSALLFVVVTCYFWIGTAPFPNPNASELLTAYGGSSNTTNQLIVIAMSALVLTALLQHPARHLILRSYAIAGVILLWLLITAVFSDAPATALRRIVYTMLVCMCGSAVLLFPRDSAQFAKLLGLCMLFAVCLSLLGIVALPRLAIHQSSDALEQMLAGDWRGHFGHKNVAAAAMVYAIFFGIYVAKARSFWLGALLVICAAMFLLNSGGKTSAAMLPAVLVLSWFFERIGSARFLFVAAGLCVMNYVLMSAAVSPAAQNFLASLGIDPTFTDRASVWQLALSAVADRPFAGYGFQAFWQMDGLVYSDEAESTWAVTAANAHNAYVDQLINGGIPLLILTLIWLVAMPCHHAGLAFKRGHQPELTRFFVRSWIFMLLLSCLESTFFNNNGPIWFTMLISVFGLRLQAYGNPVETPSEALRSRDNSIYLRRHTTMHGSPSEL